MRPMRLPPPRSKPTRTCGAAFTPIRGRLAGVFRSGSARARGLRDGARERGALAEIARGVERPLDAVTAERPGEVRVGGRDIGDAAALRGRKPRQPHELVMRVI